MTETIVGAKNARRLCAVYAGPTSGFEVIHGLVDRIMTLVEVAPTDEYVSVDQRTKEEHFRVSREGRTYAVEALADSHSESPTYFPGRAAAIMLQTSAGGEKKCIGTFGILHPEVLKSFDIQYPATSVELDLEALM